MVILRAPSFTLSRQGLLRARRCSCRVDTVVYCIHIYPNGTHLPVVER